MVQCQYSLCPLNSLTASITISSAAMMVESDVAVDAQFCRRLPKVELHAHLTGSISPQVLHDIWQWRRETGSKVDLDDPLLVMSTEKEHFNVTTFVSSVGPSEMR